MWQNFHPVWICVLFSKREKKGCISCITSSCCYYVLYKFFHFTFSHFCLSSGPRWGQQWRPKRYYFFSFHLGFCHSEKSDSPFLSAETSYIYIHTYIYNLVFCRFCIWDSAKLALPSPRCVPAEVSLPRTLGTFLHPLTPHPLPTHLPEMECVVVPGAGFPSTGLEKSQKISFSFINFAFNSGSGTL